MSVPPPKNPKSDIVGTWPKDEEVEPIYKVVPKSKVPQEDAPLISDDEAAEVLNPASAACD